MAESEYGRECIRAGSGGRVARRVEMRRAPRAGLCIGWRWQEGGGGRISIRDQSGQAEL